MIETFSGNSQAQDGHRAFQAGAACTYCRHTDFRELEICSNNDEHCLMFNCPSVAPGEKCSDVKTVLECKECGRRQDA